MNHSSVWLCRSLLTTLLLGAGLTAGCSGPARSIRKPSNEVRLAPRRARLMGCVIQEKGLKVAHIASAQLSAHMGALARAIGKLPGGGGGAWTDSSQADDPSISQVTFDLGPMGPRINGTARALADVADFLARLNRSSGGVTWRLDQARLLKDRRFHFQLQSDPQLSPRVVERATDLALAQTKGKDLNKAVKATCPSGFKAPPPAPAESGKLAWETATLKATPFFKLSGLTTRISTDLAGLAAKLGKEGEGAPLPEGFSGARLVVNKAGAELTLIWHDPQPPPPGAVKRWLRRARLASLAFSLPRWPWLERAPIRPPFPKGDDGWDLSGVTSLRSGERQNLTELLDLWVKQQALTQGLHAVAALGYHQKITNLVFSCLFRTIQPDWPFARDGSIRPAVVDSEQRADEEARGASRRGSGPLAALRSFDGVQLQWRLRPSAPRMTKKKLQGLLEQCRVLDSIAVTSGQQKGPYDGSAEVAHAGGGRPALSGVGAVTKQDASSRARQLLLAAEKISAEVARLTARVEKAAGRLPAAEGLGEVLRGVANTARLQQLRIKLARRLPTPRSKGQVRHAVLELQVNGSRLGIIMLLDTLARSGRILLPIYWSWQEIGQTRWGKLRLLVDLPYLVTADTSG